MHHEEHKGHKLEDADAEILTAKDAKSAKFGMRQLSTKARREDVLLPTFVPSW